MGEIKREEVLSRFSDSDSETSNSEDEIKDDETEDEIKIYNSCCQQSRSFSKNNS